jgi:hypothetical protein
MTELMPGADEATFHRARRARATAARHGEERAADQHLAAGQSSSAKPSGVTAPPGRRERLGAAGGHIGAPHVVVGPHVMIAPTHIRCHSAP